MTVEKEDRAKKKKVGWRNRGGGEAVYEALVSIAFLCPQAMRLDLREGRERRSATDSIS